MVVEGWESPALKPVGRQHVQTQIIWLQRKHMSSDVLGISQFVRIPKGVDRIEGGHAMVASTKGHRGWGGLLAAPMSTTSTDAAFSGMQDSGLQQRLL